MKTISISKWVAAVKNTKMFQQKGTKTSFSLLSPVQLFCVAILLFAFSARGQITNLNLGNLAPGESITITYDVTINSNLPPAVQGITNQAVVSATGVATVNSDDPKTVVLGDPTVTLLVQVPVATTVAASSVTTESATLNGVVIPGGEATGYYFEYGTNVSSLTRTAVNFLEGSSSTSTVSAAVSGLIPGTVYQFRLVATNSVGIGSGSFLNFTTTVFAITEQPVNASACIGNTATFSVAVNALASATYQWQRRDPGAGTFNSIPGATNSTYTTAPVLATDDGARYRVIVSVPNGDITSTEALLTVIPVFSLPVTYDFDGGLPPNTAVYGSAFVSNGVLQLTLATNSQEGAFLTADPAPGRFVRGFTATFKVRIDDGSGTPADGFSFNWASDLPNGPLGEEGGGSGLTVSFDTYDNVAGEAPAIDVKWNGTVVSHTSVPLSFITDFSGNFRDVAIRLNADGTLDLNYNCSAVLTDFPVPGFTPQLGARFGLGARTGGEFESHAIDDLALQVDIDPTNGVPEILGISNLPPASVMVFGTGVGNIGLEASTNLVDWFFRAGVAVDGAGNFQFIDTREFPQLFYRLKGVPPQLPTNLIAWWRAEGNYLDSFGTNNGSAVLEELPTFTAGQRGQGFLFNGTNNSIFIGGTPVAPPWTAGFWIKREDATNTSAALLADVFTGLKLEQWEYTRRVGFTQFGVADHLFNTIVPTNVWTHLTFVGVPTGTILYVNGVAAETNATAINLPRGRIGGLMGVGDHLQGVLDETTLFNRALSPAEIQQVINATRGP